MTELQRRRDETERRFGGLQIGLAATIDIIGNQACVYATGSFGRGEASDYSDLDIFILGRTRDAENDQKFARKLVRKMGDSAAIMQLAREVYGHDDGGFWRSQLSRLDDIRLKAHLIEVSREQGFKDFSGDGRYLTHHSVYDFIHELGTPEDDSRNTFTARLLLLLESRPLVGDSVYNDAIKEVVESYWRDFEDHPDTFIPAFLANDILRLWRTFCVNYEARTTSEPEEEKAKRKLQNYKLKHSRLLTCYSALLFLLDIFIKKGSVSKNDAFQMISLTPTKRVEYLKEQNVNTDALDKVLSLYDKFLLLTNRSDKDLIAIFMNRDQARRHSEESYEFGDAVFRVMHSMQDEQNRFYRLLVV